MDRNRTGLRTFGLAVLVSLAVVSCASAGPRTRVYVRVGPPAAVVEARVAAPSRAHVWVGGYHRWSGSSYVWVAGGWMRPPRPHAVWVPGHWQHSRQGYFWVEGHWR